jgi:hypothetical protein
VSRSSRLVLLLSGAALVAGFAIAPQPAAACSTCLAADPFLDAGDIAIRPKGEISGSMQVRGWSKKSGLLPGQGPGTKQNDSHRLDLFLNWTPIDRVTLSVDLPWAFNEITDTRPTERNTSRIGGFGDASLAVSGVLWRNRARVPSTWVEARALVKAPTGDSSRSVDGVKDPHLQVGTGSWDYGFGIAGVHRFDKAWLYTSGFYRLNTEGSLDYEYGDFFLINTALHIPLGDAFEQEILRPYTVGLELNFRYADNDEVNGVRYDDSGGSILYITPSLRSRLPWSSEGKGPWLRGSVQIPATSGWLDGNQQEDPIWSVGLQAAF